MQGAFFCDFQVWVHVSMKSPEDEYDKHLFEDEVQHCYKVQSPALY